jgi:hypothetical protein
MSISGIGSSVSSLLQLTALAQSNDVASATESSSNTTATTSDNAATTAATDVSLTGSGKGDLSSLILELLLALQNDVSSATTSTDTGDTSSTATTASTDESDAAVTADISATDNTDTEDDPLADLFAAIDTDGDGSISETELASFVSDLSGSGDEDRSTDVADAAPPPPHADASSSSSADTASTGDSSETSTVVSSNADQTADETQQSTYAFGMPMAEMARIIATYGAAQMSATTAS